MRSVLAIGLMAIACIGVGAQGRPLSPQYSVAYASFGPVATALYVADADGSHERRLIDGSVLDMNPSFSPDGRSVLFTSRRHGSADIYRVNIDGSGLVVCEALVPGQVHLSARHVDPIPRSGLSDFSRVGAEPQCRLVLIVGPAAQLDVVHGSPAAICVRLNMVKLEPGSFRAPATPPDERTSAFVTPPDRALDRSRNMSAAAFRLWRTARRRSGSVTATFQVGHEQRQRAIENAGNVPARKGMTEHVLRTTQLAMRVLAQRDLKAIAAGGQRRD